MPVPEVAASGLGLAFITYPAGISMMPAGGAFIGVLFFLCLVFLGLGSAFFLAHGGVSAPLRDKFGGGLTKVTALVCLAAFLVGIVFTTQGGLYWLDMIDRAVAFYGLLITGALSCIVIGWFWKPKLLRDHVNETSDFKIGVWWEWIIKLVLPVGIIFVLIYGGFMVDIPEAYEGYQIGPLNGSHVVWIVLVVTLILSFVLGRLKTRKEGGE